MFGESLLERAGLDRGNAAKGSRDRDARTRYNIDDDSPGQLRFKNHPI